MAEYPKPKGYVGSGRSGNIMRQGSAGRLSANPNTAEGEHMARGDRDNVLDCYEADFGGDYAGQSKPVEQQHDNFDD